MRSVVVRSADPEAVSRAVAAHAAHLRATHPEVRRIIWFGSWVQGTATPGSDVDLCVVLRRADKPLRDRIPDYLPVGFPVGLDVFPYTEAELNRLRTESPGWHRAIVSGRDM